MSVSHAVGDGRTTAREWAYAAVTARTARPWSANTFGVSRSESAAPPAWVQGSGFRVQGSGFRVQGSGFRVQGSGFRVQGVGFRV